ncbi:hypothetical protein F5884DRAFT_682254 [Xylogone sp. PMI_703]|nr:hypothetical protein F5884DRAFT_682254 [Xylogone sp. PMI_703]
MPKRSPKAQHQISKNNSRPRIMPAKFSSPEALPPLALLNSASKSGVLDIEPDVALQALRQYQILAQGSSSGWEKQLCADFGIQPSSLTLLAKILGRCDGEGQKLFSFELLLLASMLGDPSAVFTLVERGLKRNSLHGQVYSDALRRLDTLAKTEGDRRAMLILGKVLFAQDKDSEALDWFRKATRLTYDSPEYFLDFEGAAEALVFEGEILSKQGDQVGAQAAFQKAAFKLDDPAAYYRLALLEESLSSKQKEYLMKAASSGVIEAYHQLGSLELEAIKKSADDPNPTSISEYGMAREWFQAGAAGGYGPSMLSMAHMCKMVGQKEDGLRWLEMAKAIPHFKAQASAWESLGKMND